VVDNDECNDIFSPTTILDSQICAGDTDAAGVGGCNVSITDDVLCSVNRKKACVNEIKCVHPVVFKLFL